MANPQNLRPPWPKGVSGNPKGRPKSRVTADIVKIFGNKKEAKKFYALNGCEIDEWEAAVLTFSVDKLKALAKWDEAPAYPKGLAIAILRDMSNGKTYTIDKLRERVHGKATQRVELTGKDGADLTPPARTLTKEEAAALFAKLEEDF